MAVTIPVYLGTVNPQTVFYDEHSVFSEYEVSDQFVFCAYFQVDVR